MSAPTKEGRVAVKLDLSQRIVSIKRDNLKEIKTNWSNIRNSLIQSGKYSYGSSRKNSLKNQTIKQLKAKLSAKGISTRGITNRRNLENALNAPRVPGINISAARRRLANNNANTRRTSARKAEQRNLFSAPLANLINEAHRGIARFGPAVAPKKVPLLSPPKAGQLKYSAPAVAEVLAAAPPAVAKAVERTLERAERSPVAAKAVVQGIEKAVKKANAFNEGLAMWMQNTANSKTRKNGS